MNRTLAFQTWRRTMEWKHWSRALPLPLLLLATGCGGEASGESAPAPAAAVAVRTAPVQTTTAAEPVRATGVLAPEQEVALSFKIGGVVASLAVEEGDRVAAGTELASLDLREIDAALGKAGSARARAERALERARALYGDSVATLEQLQDATTAAEIARADLQAAAVNRQYAVVRAPVAGTVLRRSAEAGETVAPGQPVLLLGAAGAGSVLRAGLADRDAVRISVGDAATVRFDAYPERAFRGQVVQVAPLADPRTGTYQVEVAVEDAGYGLRAGLIGTTEIVPSRGEAVRLVPVEAVMEADGSRAVVYTLTPAGDRARRVPVEIGFLLGDRVVVRGGLEGVEAVVTDGVAYLTDGATVQRLVR